MTKDETATPADKGVKDRPYEMVADPEGAGMKVTPEFLQSRDVKEEFEPRKLTPRVPGPMTGIDSMPDREYISVMANPEELKSFRAQIEARKASAIPVKMILLGCPKCGRWMRGRPEWAGGNCIFCNFRNLVGGGRLRRATAEEEQAWLAREKAAHDKWIAEAPKRQAELDAYNKRRAEDMDRPPISRDPTIKRVGG